MRTLGYLTFNVVDLLTDPKLVMNRVEQRIKEMLEDAKSSSGIIQLWVYQGGATELEGKK